MADPSSLHLLDKSPAISSSAFLFLYSRIEASTVLSSSKDLSKVEFASAKSSSDSELGSLYDLVFRLQSLNGLLAASLN